MKAAEPASPSSTLHAALLDYFEAPGKYQLTLRQPALLFASLREILQVASGRSGSEGPDGARLCEAANFFIRAALLYPGADHYAVLGLAPGEVPPDLKERYRLLMRMIHPDFAQGSTAWPADAATRVNRAYEVLSSPVLQREYDEQLAALRTQRPVAPAKAGGFHPAVRRGEERRPRLGKKAALVFGLAVGIPAVLLLLPRAEPDQLVQRSVPAPKAREQARTEAELSARASPALVSSPQLPHATEAPAHVAQPVAPSAMVAAAPVPPAAIPAERLAVAPVAPHPAPAPPPAPAPVVAAAAPRPASVVAAAAPRPAPVVAAAAPRPAPVVAAAAPRPAPVPPPAVPVPAVAPRPPVQPAPVAQRAPEAARPMPLPVAVEEPVRAAPIPVAVAPAPVPVASPPPVNVVAVVNTPSPSAAPAGKLTATLALPAVPAPTLADAQPLLTQVLQILETGSGEQLLRLLDTDARRQPGAVALSRQYEQLVKGGRPVHLSQVEFAGEPRDGGVLLVTGRMRLHAGEPTIGSYGQKLLLRAEFAQRGGRVQLTALSGTAD